MNGKLFLVLGPSGVGKSTVVKEVLSQMPEIGFIPSVTTRNPRVDEIQGVDYCFVTQTEFFKMRDDSIFLEWDQPFGGHFYGIPIAPYLNELNMGKSLIKEIAYHGLDQIMNSPLAPHSVSIFLMPDSQSFTELGGRVLERNDGQAVDRVRLFEKELEKRFICKYIAYSYYKDIVRSVDSVKELITLELKE